MFTHDESQVPRFIVSIKIFISNMNKYSRCDKVETGDLERICAQVALIGSFSVLSPSLNEGELKNSKHE